jgi:hypothetical protein
VSPDLTDLGSADTLESAIRWVRYWGKREPWHRVGSMQVFNLEGQPEPLCGATFADPAGWLMLQASRYLDPPAEERCPACRLAEVPLRVAAAWGVTAADLAAAVEANAATLRGLE